MWLKYSHYEYKIHTWQYRNKIGYKRNKCNGNIFKNDYVLHKETTKADFLFDWGI